MPRLDVCVLSHMHKGRSIDIVPRLFSHPVAYGWRLAHSSWIVNDGRKDESSVNRCKITDQEKIFIKIAISLSYYCNITCYLVYLNAQTDLSLTAVVIKITQERGIIFFINVAMTL